jgi:hypothetical protein
MEESPSGGCYLGDRSNNLDAWTNYVRAHGQESMKIFELRSMMQEHHQRIKRASTSSRKDSWTVPTILFAKLLCHPLNGFIHKEAHLYCKGDLEPSSSRP